MGTAASELYTDVSLVSFKMSEQSEKGEKRVCMGISKTLKYKEDQEKELTVISDEDLKRLQAVLLKAYLDIQNVCEKYGLRIMLGGGSCLGAVRHKGFIPWDDDFDTNMPREDYEKFKEVFQRELGDRYILNASDYSERKAARFPRVVVKNTKLLGPDRDEEAEYSGIRIDIFIIENVPRNLFHRTVKGLYCHALMLIASSVRAEKKDKEKLPEEAKKKFSLFGLWRGAIGTLFSYRSQRTWLLRVNKACQYRRETGLVSIPTGRNHYFKEMQPREVFLPMSKGSFEGHEVNLPGDPHAYLSKLYGSDYMTPPPPEKREKHSFVEIDFGEYQE